MTWITCPHCFKVNGHEPGCPTPVSSPRAEAPQQVGETLRRAIGRALDDWEAGRIGRATTRSGLIRDAILSQFSVAPRKENQ
jgi:hypothetical protein